MFLEILLNILAVLAIVILGTLVVVIVADLILFMIDGKDGIFIKKSKSKKLQAKKAPVKNDDIVVYANKNKGTKNDDIVVYKGTKNDVDNKIINENDNKPKKIEIINGAEVKEIDYDKAIEEQKELMNKNGAQPMSINDFSQDAFNDNFDINTLPNIEPSSEDNKIKKVENTPIKDDLFFDDDEDDDGFDELLTEVIEEVKNSEQKVAEDKLIEVEDVKVNDNKSLIDDETSKELDELRQLKEQQKKEIEEFRQLKEDYAREKEEELAEFRNNLDKAKEEELEKLKQETIKEQEKLEDMKKEMEEEKVETISETIVEEQEPIIKETIIKDEEELNKLKYKNLMTMNNRLTRIIRDTERLQNQKQKAIEKAKVEKAKLQIKEQEEIIREQEKILKEQESLALKATINQKLNTVSDRVGKYKLDTKIVQVVKPEKIKEDNILNSDIQTLDKEPMKNTAKPVFEKEYYEQKLSELDLELKDAEKELRINKSEYIPLTRIYKAYLRDSEKLRKKEMQIAKQKIALYGVNSTKVNPEKKEKLDNNLALYTELKDSVTHCEEVIKKNKDRYPILEKNNKLILKQINRINDDIKICEKSIEYYLKKENK